MRTTLPPEAELARLRDALVNDLSFQGIADPGVLAAVKKVPRHRFVPPHLLPHAYEDRPLPIGHGQTVSQPYVMALSTAALALGPPDRVLEIGTGSGYQTAILAELAGEVYTVERLSDLSRSARELLGSLGYRNIRFHVGDGTKGWLQEAPFAAILVTAGAPHVPEALLAQLAPGGRLVIPVGGRFNQELTLIYDEGGRFVRRLLCPCTFVPLIGEEGWT